MVNNTSVISDAIKSSSAEEEDQIIAALADLIIDSFLQQKMRQKSSKNALQ